MKYLTIFLCLLATGCQSIEITRDPGKNGENRYFEKNTTTAFLDIYSTSYSIPKKCRNSWSFVKVERGARNLLFSLPVNALLSTVGFVGVLGSSPYLGILIYPAGLGLYTNTNILYNQYNVEVEC